MTNLNNRAWNKLQHMPTDRPQSKLPSPYEPQRTTIGNQKDHAQRYPNCTELKFNKMRNKMKNRMDMLYVESILEQQIK